MGSVKQVSFQPNQSLLGRTQSWRFATDSIHLTADYIERRQVLDIQLEHTGRFTCSVYNPNPVSFNQSSSSNQMFIINPQAIAIAIIIK